jgi:hypothetical protein
MKRLVKVVMVVACASSVPVAIAASHVIQASVEASGNQHPGTVAVRGPASVTCLDAQPQRSNATCYVTGPGLDRQLPKGANAGTSGAGTVTLTCNGNGALRCSARVDD